MTSKEQEIFDLANKLSKKMFRAYRDFFKENSDIELEDISHVTLTSLPFVCAIILDLLLIESLDDDYLSRITYHFTSCTKHHFLHIRKQKKAEKTHDCQEM